MFLCSSLICLQTYYSLLKLGVDIREFFVALALKQSISFREIQYVVCICVQCVVLPRLVVFYDNLLAGKELRQMLSDSREKNLPYVLLAKSHSVQYCRCRILCPRLSSSSSSWTKRMQASTASVSET